MATSYSASRRISGATTRPSSAGGGGERAPITIDFSLTPPACPGDHNNDLAVDFADITYVLSNWSNPFTFASITNTLANFGATCP